MLHHFPSLSEQQHTLRKGFRVCPSSVHVRSAQHPPSSDLLALGAAGTAPSGSCVGGGLCLQCSSLSWSSPFCPAQSTHHLLQACLFTCFLIYFLSVWHHAASPLVVAPAPCSILHPGQEHSEHLPSNWPWSLCTGVDTQGGGEAAGPGWDWRVGS